MKKVFTLALMAVAMVFVTETSAQEFSGLDKSPMDAASYPSDYKVSDKAVRIIYSRPQLKGRSLAELAKPGEVWRTGANEAPEITFYKDVNFGGQDVKAGTYALLTIPGEKEWTVILHDNLNQWGSYFYKEGGDVARVSAAASSDEKSLEAFSIAFKEVEGGVHMVMGWDTTRVAVPIMM
ncbi:DUF2911 domain-containing protein [Flavobacteriaceae bacterium TP-CH-4]|uniref:DUF2911 domain-containing protein n=1 Tax=Pelagihabitans pacificus TaxID=2696054 RepID=A0A967APC4_9FLAO|nr:DUF2911 domain-containing protein [Pelagihabitans pacificus]NHF57981.1 DUF2911 domain-containing protein [Pelagihabitans pacificus]